MKNQRMYINVSMPFENNTLILKHSYNAINSGGTGALVESIVLILAKFAHRTKIQE